MVHSRQAPLLQLQAIPLGAAAVERIAAAAVALPTQHAAFQGRHAERAGPAGDLALMPQRCNAILTLRRPGRGCRCQLSGTLCRCG